MTERADKLSDFDRGIQLGAVVVSKACGQSVAGTKAAITHALKTITRPPDLHEPRLREACETAAKCLGDDAGEGDVRTAAGVYDVPDAVIWAVREAREALAATEGGAK
jgi:hypothetical protein